MFDSVFADTTALLSSDLLSLCGSNTQVIQSKEDFFIFFNPSKDGSSSVMTVNLFFVLDYFLKMYKLIIWPLGGSRNKLLSKKLLA